MLKNLCGALTEAALSSISSPLGVFCERGPLFAHSQPSFLVCISDRTISLAKAFFCLRSKPSDIYVGHLRKVIVVARINTHCGARRPDDFSQPLICAPVSACRALLRSRSRSTQAECLALLSAYARQPSINQGERHRDVGVMGPLTKARLSGASGRKPASACSRICQTRCAPLLRSQCN